MIIFNSRFSNWLVGRKRFYVLFILRHFNNFACVDIPCFSLIFTVFAAIEVVVDSFHYNHLWFIVYFYYSFAYLAWLWTQAFILWSVSLIILRILTLFIFKSSSVISFHILCIWVYQIIFMRSQSSLVVFLFIYF